MVHHRCSGDYWGWNWETQCKAHRRQQQQQQQPSGTRLSECSRGSSERLTGLNDHRLHWRADLDWLSNWMWEGGIGGGGLVRKEVHHQEVAIKSPNNSLIPQNLNQRLNHPSWTFPFTPKTLIKIGIYLITNYSIIFFIFLSPFLKPRLLINCPFLKCPLTTDAKQIRVV